MIVKRFALILCLVFCFYFCVAPDARADASSQAERQIQALYDSQDAAMGRRDLKGSILHVDPAYVRRHADGSAESYKQWAAELSAWFAHKMSAIYVTMVERIRMVGPQTAFVVATHHVNFGVMVAPNVPGDAVRDDQVHDKWIKRPHGWMLIQTFEMRSLPTRKQKRIPTDFIRNMR